FQAFYEFGIGFSSETWRTSKTIGWVENLPQVSWIYSNERLALTYLTGKSAYSVPEKFDSVKAQDRSEFDSEFEVMHARLKEPDSYLVLFNPYNLKWGLPTRDEITFPLSALERFDDAVIYVNPVNLE
nr:hypothetical protein [Anaerolineales bacterium]